ncbi:MAG TPA: hypothetical protein PK264_23300 [Hyphomicrobiaceae bacterium]|nr:hypothetical protein [Hyphomicrobiaceae bacterium]
MVLIDDQGEFWDGASRQLRTAFDSPFSGGEFSSYAVRNLGFVAVDQFGSSCQIRLRPAMVSSKAVAALVEWLHKRSFQRVSAAWFTTDWAYEIFPSLREALGRLASVIEEARTPASSDFKTKAIGPNDVKQANALVALMDRWQSLSGEGRFTELEWLIRQSLGKRYAFVERDDGSSKLVFRELGSGIIDHHQDWRATALGQPLEALPDRAYGQWVNASFEASLAAGAPRIEAVDAIVRWPHRGRTRLRYKRVIVPLAVSSGRPALLGGSILDDSIDLRADAR